MGPISILIALSVSRKRDFIRFSMTSGGCCENGTSFTNKFIFIKIKQKNELRRFTFKIFKGLIKLLEWKKIEFELFEFIPKGTN